MSTPASLARALSETPDPRRWAALVVLLTGAFLSPLDFFIVNVALPSIAGELHAGEGQVQLVISAYAVAYAVCLITGGRLGDLFGRKRVFMLGLVGFAASSALCGLAWSPASLITGRMIQGLAAAALAPQALASIHALFPAHERGRALGIYGVMLGLSAAAGQLLGGVLVAADLFGLGWRVIFLINLPVSLAAFVAGLVLLRDSRDARRPRLDWGGVALSAVALTCFVLPLIEGRLRGWPWWTLAMLLASPLLGWLFVTYERRLSRVGGEPLVAIETFRNSGVLRALGAILTLYLLSALFLTLAIYLQDGLGFTPLQSGLEIVPFSLGFLAASTYSAWIGRVAGRAASSLGFVLSAAGLAGLAALVAASAAPAPPSAVPLALALTVIGAGMGVSIPTMMRVVVERVEPHRAGLVGGLVNSALQVSGAVGVAALGGLFYAVVGAQDTPKVLAEGFAVTMLGVAVCHLAGAALAAGLSQPRGAAPGVLRRVIAE